MAAGCLHTKGKRSIFLLVAIVSLSGCASHIVFAPLPDGVGAGGQSFRRNQVSILGDRGMSSDGTGYVAKECRSAPLTEVKVKRNFGQTLATLLTLGMVTPVTIEFKCAKASAPPPAPAGDHF